MANNKYTIELLAGIKPVNDGTYPMVRAQDIEINNNDTKNRLSDIITSNGIEILGNEQQNVSLPGDNQSTQPMDNPMITKINIDRASIQNTEQYDTEFSGVPGVGSISTGFSHNNMNGAGNRFETIATGTGAVAIGRGAEAFGRQSLAVGCLSRTGPQFETKDPNYQSEQKIPTNNEGAITDDAGKNSLAVGFNNISEGESSITMGSTNYAKGKTTIAIGSGNTAYEEGSQVYGNGLITNPPPSKDEKGKQQIIIGNYNTDSSTADFIIANGTANNRKNVIEITNEDIDIKGNLTIASKTNIGDGAKAITPNSMVIGRYRYGDTKAEHDGTLAIGGDNIAAGRYSIASGCETSTGVPLAEQKKYIINLLSATTSNYIITKENESLKFTFETETPITELTHEFDLFQYIKDVNSNYKNSHIITVVMDSIQRVEKKDEEGNIILDEKGNTIYEKIRYLPCLTTTSFNINDEIQAWENLTDEEFSIQWHKSNFTLINTNLGNNSFATGFRCAAIGQSSAAIGGRDCRALADYSVAIGGRDCVVNAPYSAGISIGTTGLTVNEPNTVKIGNNNFNFRLNSNGTVVLGPNTLSSSLANTILIGPDNNNHLRINSSGFTFTGNINVPDNFIKNIWS